MPTKSHTGEFGDIFHFSTSGLGFGSLRARGALRNLADRPRLLMRQTITGDKSKRVRDHVRETTAKQTQRVKEKMHQPPVMRFMDKAGFLLGVVGLSLTEWIFAAWPEYFRIWYCLMIPTLVVLRYYMYVNQKYQYFLLDFCYFAQVSTLLNIFILPESAFFWKVNYVLAHGPLLWAIPAWRNSFVFHSLDKVTSLFIHGFPPLLCYCARWHVYQKSGRLRTATCEDVDQCRLSWQSFLVAPVGAYFLWQVLYIVKTDLMDRAKIERDPELATSVRWLSADTKHALNCAVLWTVRKLRLFGPTEVFDAETWKTKAVFWVTQLLFTLLTILPGWFAFHSQLFNGLLLWAVFLVSVWNGANYYIEVFSEKYVLKFRVGKEGVDAASAVEVSNPPGSSPPSTCASGPPFPHIPDGSATTTTSSSSEDLLRWPESPQMAAPPVSVSSALQ
eukprot:RCo050887